MSKDAVSNVSEMTREALKDGKITPEERTAIKEAARQQFNTVISPTMTKRLNVHMDDTDKFITAKINTAVEEAMQNITK
jgi:3-oxoacyl-[acyl-carrier-protein] synthase III